MTEAPCDVTEAEVTPALEDASAEVNVDGKPAVVGDENWECLLACDGFMVPEGEVLEVDITEGDVVPIRYLMRSFGTTDDAGIADDSIPVETFGFDEMQVSDEEFAIQDFVSDENPPTEEWDPSWAYQSFVAFDGVATDGEPTDEVTENVDDSEVKVKVYHSLKPDAADDDVIFEELVAIEDTPPVDGWDPSWAYRSFAGSPEGALDGEVKIDDIVLEDGVPVDENVTFDDAPPVDGWDPSWAYRSFAGSPEGALDGEVKIDDIVPEDEVPVDENVTFEDAPPVDGWDQSWVYRTLESPSEESLDSDGDGLPDDFVMYPYDPIAKDQLGEDGLGCGVAPEGFVPGDEPINDFDGDGIPDEIVLDPVDSDGSFTPFDLRDAVPAPYDFGNDLSPADFVTDRDEPINDFDGDGLPDEVVMDPVDSDGSFDPRILMTFGGVVDDVKGSVIDGADGETKDLTDSNDLGIEEEMYLYPVDEVFEFGDTEFQVSDSDDSSVPQIRFLSAAGGSEVQRTLASSSAPAFESPVAATPLEATTNNVATSALSPALQPSIATNVVPARQVASNSLFSASRDKSTIGIALTSPSGSGTVSSPLGTKSSSTPKRAKSQLQLNSNTSGETSELENLSPLIGDETDSPDVDSAPNQQNIESDDQVTTESAVSRNENVDSSSRAVAQRSQPSYINRPGMIDEVMSQYAENSFNA